jgi:predicted DCC family thiol-disulfide oxidoreductase YuxK
MITLVVGEMGSGKTLYALNFIRAAVTSRRPVFTNIALKPDCPFADKVALIGDEQFPIAARQRNAAGHQYFWNYISAPRSVVVLDEANIYFDTSMHREMEREAIEAMQYIRKAGMDLVLLCHTIDNLWVRVRRMAARFIVCDHNWRSSRMVRMMGKDWSRFWYAEFADKRFCADTVRGVGHFSWREASKMFGWYDTRQIMCDTARFAMFKGKA